MDHDFESPPPPRSGNGMGVAGFVVSLVGLVPCGLLCPLGLIFSLIGLGRQPRGLAIAGTVIGGIGSLGIVGAVALVLYTGPQKFATKVVIWAAEIEIETYTDRHGEPPDEKEGNRLIADTTDGWDRPLRYEIRGERFRITSAGPDGVFDTEDDVGD
jgi:hypothetical protein